MDGDGHHSPVGPDSIANVLNFQRHLAALETDKESEDFIRRFLIRAPGYAPLRVIRRVAECLLQCRKEELANEAQSN